MTVPLTPERLREHWFSRPAYPHWQYRLENLLFGLEVEYHVAQKGNHRRLFKKADFEAFVRLLKQYGYAKYESVAHHWRVSKDTELGYIVIKPDFAFHVLEIALPPRSDLAVMTNLLNEVLQEVDSCIDDLGFERLSESFLHLNPSELELVETARLEGYLECLQDQARKNEFSERHFPAFMAATHVHLNVSAEEDLRLLPILYELEWLALTLFDRTHHPPDVRSLRTLYYRNAFGNDYRLVGVPERIPFSLSEYIQQFNASPRLFPYDPFFPVRDCSLIRPTMYGTLEFRSACSPLKIETAGDIGTSLAQIG